MKFRQFFQRFDWLFVVLVAPVMLFPQAHLVGLLLLYPAVLGLTWWAWGDVFPLTALNPAILLMGAMIGVSIFVTPDLVSSMGKITGVLLGILVFATVTRHSRTRVGWMNQLGLFLLAGMLLAGVGLLGTRWMTSKLQLFNDLVARLPTRLISLPGAEQGINPNELAGALLWIVPVVGMAGLALLADPRWFASRSGKGKLNGGILAAWVIGLGIAFIFGSGVLVLSQSRDGYLAMALATPLLLFMLVRGRARYWMGGLLIVAIVAGIVILSQEDTSLALNNVAKSLPAEGADFSINSMFGRKEIWGVAVQGIKDKPLTGLGMNIFRSSNLIPDEFFNMLAPDIAHAHNEALQAALDLGLPGLVGFLALYFGAGGMLAKLIRGSGTARILAIGLLGGLLAHFLFGLTDAIALGAKPSFLFWWLLGMVCGLYEQNLPRLAVHE